MSTKILLADDHEILRESLRRLLDEQGDIEVVGDAGDVSAINNLSGFQLCSLVISRFRTYDGFKFCYLTN